MCSGADKVENLRVAERLIDVAAERDARFIVLPEMFNCLGPRPVLRAGAEPLAGPTAQWARQQAVRHRIWLLAGSFVEKWDSSDRTRNTSLLISPGGDVVATYHKIHLFDCDVPGAEFHESQFVTPGDEIVTATADGVGTVGMSICYDLRFPELYRILALQGAEIVVVPAAFTAKTGPPHWEVLLRARAIENQVYVIAAGQHGRSGAGLAWHGHSMIIDPWGTVIARAGDPGTATGAAGGNPGGAALDVGDAVVVADIDLDFLARTRRTLPSLVNRRPAAYRFPDPDAT